MTAKSLTALLLLGMCAAKASAAPLANSGASRGERTLVEMVHGCHRSAEDGPGGWHRHVGPYCERIRASRSRGNPYARCETRCRYVGPIKQCRRYCD